MRAARAAAVAAVLAFATPALAVTAFRTASFIQEITGAAGLRAANPTSYNGTGVGIAVLDSGIDASASNGRRFCRAPGPRGHTDR